MMSIEEKREFASRIQKYQFEDESASPWKISHMIFQASNSNQWIKINYDHSVYNGLDVGKVFLNNESSLLNIPVHQQIRLLDGMCAEGIDSCGDEIFVGPPGLNAKDVIRDFNDTFGCIDFYVPIDMSHAFLAPALMNYTFHDPSKFDENWKELCRIKKNENDYLLIDDRWKDYLHTQLGWVAFMKFETDDAKIICQHYDYDLINLQGLGIVVTNAASYWTFSFFKNPSQKHYFIDKYCLTPIVTNN